MNLPLRGLFLGATVQTTSPSSSSREGKETEFWSGVSKPPTSFQMKVENWVLERGVPVSARAEMLVAGPELAWGQLTGHFLWSVPSPRLVCLWGPQSRGKGVGGNLVCRAEGTHPRIGKGKTLQALWREHFSWGPLTLVCASSPLPLRGQTPRGRGWSVWVTAPVCVTQGHSGICGTAGTWAQRG